MSETPKTIEAQDRSPITLNIGDNVTALTNTRITIQCPTSGVPKPTVIWTKDGQEILSGGRYTFQDDGSLLINVADEKDSARYTCTADSVAGKDNASSTVQIVGKKSDRQLRFFLMDDSDTISAQVEFWREVLLFISLYMIHAIQLDAIVHYVMISATDLTHSTSFL